MKKEELEKEAKESWWNDNNCSGALPTEKIYECGYLAGAEPREKRIAELEKRCANYEMKISKMEKGTCDICKETEKDNRIAELETRCNELFLQTCEQAEKIKELEAQIEKMKCCENCVNYMISGKCPSFFRTGWCKNWELAD